MIEGLTKQRQKELLGAAVELLKSGAEPSPDDVVPDNSRAARRQVQRAAGNRGSKTAKRNPHRHENRLRAGGERVRKAVLLDDALHAAKNRVDHPVLSRLRGPR